MAHLELTPIQQTMMLIIRVANRPGYSAHPRQGTLAALERRGLLQSRPDATNTAAAIWTLTAPGHAWADEHIRRDKIERRL